jgi:hypothetical protein
MTAVLLDQVVDEPAHVGMITLLVVDLGSETEPAHCDRFIDQRLSLGHRLDKQALKRLRSFVSLDPRCHSGSSQSALSKGANGRRPCNFHENVIASTTAKCFNSPPSVSVDGARVTRRPSASTPAHFQRR